MEKILRCAIYIRVSTEEQHLNGLSLPAQRMALKKYAEKNGYTIVGYYSDEGISARKSMKQRKGLLSLLEDVKRDKIDMILVTKLDRWFRNIKDYNITEEILQAHNCHWKTIFENYDSSTANGQMVINIMLSVNQAECDRTSERIKAVLDYKRSIGEVTSGRCACYGYKVVNNRLVKDEKVSHIINDAYQHYFTCYSIRDTIRYLQDKYGEDAPSFNKIDRLFKNETYMGRNKDNYNYCEPYISPEQFERAKNACRSKVYGDGRNRRYIFASLIKCPICGNNFTGHIKKQKLKSGGVSIYVRYRCCNKQNPHKGANLLERKIEEYMITHVEEQLKTEISRIISKKKNKKPKKENIQAEIDRLNLQFQKGRISEEYYDSQYDMLSAKLKEQQKSTLEDDIESYKKLQNAFGGNWLEIYNQLDNAHKNAFWKSTIDHIDIDPETRKIKGFTFV